MPESGLGKGSQAGNSGTAGGSAGTADSVPWTISRISFRDPSAAQKGLSEIAARTSRDLSESLISLLADSPDPDFALSSLESLVASGGEATQLLRQHPRLLHYAIAIFGHSRFLGETLLRNTDLLPALLREGTLDRSFSREDFHEAWARFRARSFENDIALLLARFKRREYVRIMLRDVLAIAELAEATAEISALSDMLIEEALREASSQLQRRCGAPQRVDDGGRLVDTPFCVLSLGKLGGNELNYSSDVDLLYLYGGAREAPGAAISHREYFVRLAQTVTDYLSRATREGSVFRIDMRLRPQGSEGELAVSLDHALRYYAESAQDWELQALIKARHSAGDLLLAREFLRAVQPRVYGSSEKNQGQDSFPAAAKLQFAAIETALETRERLGLRRRADSRGTEINVKLDRGGIRDIEFLVQCLQRVYGGREAWLRSRGTLFALQKLHDKGHISGRDFQELSGAYEFLRQVEHRLQLRRGQQTHSLPSERDERAILARSLAGRDPSLSSPEELERALRERMAAVAEIYNRIVHHQQARQKEESPEAEFALGAGVQSPVDQSYEQILERLASDAPAIYEVATRGELGDATRRNLQRFLSAVFTSALRYAVVARNPMGVERALALFDGSDYLTDVLIRHPEEIAALTEVRVPPDPGESGELFSAPFGWTENVSDPIFRFVATSATAETERLALLRRHYRHRTFAIGARDLMEARPVYASLAAYTGTADDAIHAALTMAGAPTAMAVLALGRLGTGEFDVLSDADVIFVRDEGVSAPIAARAAEKAMHILAAYTREGLVFPVDARLRPHGHDGELVITPAQLQSYFEREAQAWEALSYTKLRYIAGAKTVADEASRAAGQLFARFRNDAGFGPAVREMRQRLESGEESPNLKTSPGAMYDIDFATGFLLVKHGVREMRGNLRDRLWRLAEAGALTKTDAAALDHAAELFRTVDHVIRLVAGRSRRWLPGSGHARAVTERNTFRILRRTSERSLEEELLETMQRVRAIYERILGVPP